MRPHEGAANETSVHRIFELLASFKLGLVGSRNLDFLSGPRVPPFTRLTACHRESAKSNEADFISLFQRVGNNIKDAVDRFGRFRLC